MRRRQSGLSKVEFAASAAVASALAAALLWQSAALVHQAKAARLSAMRSEIVAAASEAKALCLAQAATGAGACPQGAFAMEAMGPSGPVAVLMLRQYPAPGAGGIGAMAKLAGVQADGAWGQGEEFDFPVGADRGCRVRYQGPAAPGSPPEVVADASGC